MLRDHQGSARVVTNETAQIVARHDYLPYGEEVWAGAGQRTAAQGYNATHNIREKYALTERDEATGLDHTRFRKYEQAAGRWTSPDPYTGSMSIADPQSFNRYAYVQNDPVNFIDPSGLNIEIPGVWESVDVNARDGYVGSQAMGILRMLLFNPMAGASGGGDTGGGEPGVVDPQKSITDKYSDCVASIFGKSPNIAVPSLQTSAAIVAISRFTNVAPELFALTWAAETGFGGPGQKSNPNDGSPGNADVGPMQINYRTWHKSPLINKIEGGVRSVFDITTTGSEPFNGLVSANLQMGGHILASYGGQGRTAAGKYRVGEGRFSRKAAGKAEFEKRASRYDREAPLYKNLLNCLFGPL